MNALKFGKFIPRAAKLIFALTFCIFIAAFASACGEESTQPPAPPTQDSGNVTPDDPCRNGHTFGEYTLVKPATCKEAGKEERVCSVCGKKEERDIAKTDEHTFGEYTLVKAATCKEAGKEERTCSVCGKTEARDIAKTDEHTFGGYTVVKAATCKEAGKEERVCSVCGKKEERVLEKTDKHIFGGYTLVKAATCKEAGKEERVCSVCGKTEARDIAISEEHEYVDQKVLEEATCVKAGRKEVKCSVCGKTEERAIPATGKHTFVNGKCECGMEEAGYVPPTELFRANVFRLEGYDLGEKLLGSCSGFVLNEKGLFVTSGDVLKNAYTAKAVFETQSGTKTTLQIKQISLQNGFFIGKIENFGKVSQDFRAFPLKDTTDMDETVYAVGVTKDGIQVLAGKTVEDDSAFEGKVSGAHYLAFGGTLDKLCFGGLLLNYDLDTIGMLCAADQTGTVSYALSAQDILKSTEKEPKLESFAKTLHPENAGFVELFDRVKNLEGFQKTEGANGVTAYVSEDTTNETNSQGTSSVDKETHTFRSDLTMEIKIDCRWGNGDHLEVKLSGKWNGKDGFSDLTFEFKYTWQDGQSYTVKSSSVSYNEDVSKTLPTFTKQSSSGYTITQHNIDYAKAQFNYCYEWLLFYTKG